MKIALLHYAAPPIVGGVETVVGEHARLMADAGHQVSIIAGRGAQLDDRIAFVSLPEVDSRNEEILAMKSDLDAGRVPPGFSLLANRILQRLTIQLAGTDWIVAHNVCSLNKNLALTAALRRFAILGTASRLILWHHDLAWIAPRYRGELHDGYPWDLLRTDWPDAAQVAVSERRGAELAQLLGVAPTRIRVIPNGIDAAEFLGLGERTRVLVREMGLGDSTPLILLPVRITRRKNIELALRMLAALRREFPDARLVITGPLGPHNPANAEYYEGLLRLRRELGLEGASHFLADVATEPVPHEIIADLYRLADVLFLPSTEEGFGIPILEAGLAGVPVFCSDIESLREVGGKDVQYFAPEMDADRLAGQIASALDSSPRYALRRRVLRNYTWDRIYSTHIAPLLEGR